jgi:hypothetical protein
MSHETFSKINIASCNFLSDHALYLFLEISGSNLVLLVGYLHLIYSDAFLVSAVQTEIYVIAA